MSNQNATSAASSSMNSGGQAAGATRQNRLRGRFMPYLLGNAMLVTAVAGAVFAVYALVLKESPAGYLVTTFVAAGLGLWLRLRGSPNADPSPREAIGSVLLIWLLLPAIGAVPYAMAGHLAPLDAFFEAMSGFTTTGATVISDYSHLPATLLMWRALSQWVGGIGIVVMFVALFPQLAIAGRQMFFAEAPGSAKERLAPRLRNTAALVMAVYAVLTAVAIAAYMATGMRPFDAVAHALASLSAGGFSPVGTGLAAYGAATQWVTVLFMFLAGISFPLLYRAVSGRPSAILKSAELRAYVGVLLVAGLLLAFLNRNIYDGLSALRHGLFQAVSITTTTGFASADYTSWGLPAQAVIVALLFVGGCAGSASGGVKIARWLVVIKHSVREVRRALHPRAVIPVRVGNRIMPEEVMRSVVAFLTLYLGLFFAGTVTLVFMGEDLPTAFTAAIACLGNTGIGLGSIGPFGNFETLHPISRGMLTFLMYAGRLEVVTVFVVFDPSFWRRGRRFGWFGRAA